MSTWLFNSTPLFTSRFKWIARFGIVRIGRLKSTNTIFGANTSSLRKATFPDTDNGRSNHVLKIGPPYTSTFSFL